MRGELRVGTSGWHYLHWRQVFYPGGLKPSGFLEFYARHFDTVEINNSFYRLPSREVFEGWAEQVPAGFLFAVKASRYITHIKKLKDPEEPIARLFSRAEGLGDKMGPSLFQLPPAWKRDVARLEACVASLPRGRRVAFEFREPSWFDPSVYEVLKRAGCALCVASSRRRPSVREVTAPFSFVRFHGGRSLDSHYTGNELRSWAAWVEELLASGIDVYAYFNNDARGFAVRDAFRFKELLSA
ncbi:MAG: DUF72 domain-containing protein [Candidatus Geothermincolia bacterium]